jgi:hypothetical protein
MLGVHWRQELSSDAGSEQHAGGEAETLWRSGMRQHSTAQPMSARRAANMWQQKDIKSNTTSNRTAGSVLWLLLLLLLLLPLLLILRLLLPDAVAVVSLLSSHICLLAAASLQLTSCAMRLSNHVSREHLTFRSESKLSPNWVATLMRTILFMPSLSIQLIAALAASALRAPTPTAISRDCVAKFCRVALKKRCKSIRQQQEIQPIDAKTGQDGCHNSIWQAEQCQICANLTSLLALVQCPAHCYFKDSDMTVA